MRFPTPGADAMTCKEHQTVGDGLVPSRSRVAATTHAGDHKGRPYGGCAVRNLGMAMDFAFH